MSKVLVTGGCGYIGSHANRLLSQSGYQTVVLDNLSRGHREFAQWGRFVQMDLGDREGLLSLMQAEKFDAVMHFAAYAYVGESVTDPAMYYANNVAGTLNLLDAARQAGIGKFIFSSTCATYGSPIRLPMDEEHPQSPINPYGQGKLMVERALKDFDRAYGLRHVNLRYFNAAGAAPKAGIGEWHSPETHLIPLALLAALGRIPQVKVFGTDYDTPDGTCLRDYVHVDDLAQAHLLALEHLANGGKSDSFNLGNGNGFSVKEVIETARKVSGKEIKAVPAPRREGDPPRLIASSEKAQRVLGWKPKYPGLEEIVRTAWEWHLKDS